MVAAGIAWITFTPYGTGLLIGHWKRLNRAVARFVGPALLLGWAAVVVVVVGILFKQEEGGVTAALIAAPFVGFAFWMPVPDDRDDDGDDPPEPPAEPPPSGDVIDWDAFERVRGGWSRDDDRELELV